jgi:two-component system, LytTR family, response regulator
VIRAVVVDDEPLARERVKMLLAKHEDVDVIGEAGDGDVARRVIEELRPDLVLLDIQMPAMDGLELLQSLPEERRPVVVFLTAHGHHAVAAFEAAALDYVLKPVEPKRLALALDRARRQLSHGVSDTARRALLEVLGGLTATTPDRFLVRKSHGRRVVVKVSEIEWVGAERNYVRLHTAAGSHLMRETIGRIEEQLDPKRYVRIHRSAIVGLEFVRELATDADGSLFVTMRSGEKLSVGDSYRETFERLIGRAL